MKTSGGVLRANQQIVVELSLARHLDLSLPGKYRLKISRQPDESASGAPSAPLVVSNTIEFEIKER